MPYTTAAGQERSSTTEAADMAKQAKSETVQRIERALDAAGQQSFRGGAVRGRSGYTVDEQVVRGTVRGHRVHYVTGGNDIACTDYARSVILPTYANALRAAGFAQVGITTTQLVGEWVSVRV